MPSGTAFLSNYQSLNLGNHALTATIYDLLRQSTHEPVLGFRRLPNGATPAAKAALRASRWTTFVSDLRRLAEASPPGGAIAGGTATFAVSNQQVLGGFGTVRRAAVSRVAGIPGVRDLRARRSLPRCGPQLRAELDCAVSIYNPAGEIERAAAPVMRFVEVGVAIDAGHPAGLVNFSFEPGPLIAAAAREVFPAVGAIYVRDELSREEVLACGGRADLTEVVPDAVFLERAPGWERRDDRDICRVGIVVNGVVDTARPEAWVQVVRQVRSTGADVSLMSNEHGRDEAFLARLGRVTATPILGCAATIPEYLKALQGLDAVVSTRFHTCVMALIVGVPVVPVEGASHRIRGALAAVGLPDVVVDGRQDPTDFAQAVRTRLDDGGARLSASRIREIGAAVTSAYAKLPRLLATA